MKKKPNVTLPPVIIRHYGSNHHCNGKGVKSSS